MRRLVHLLHGRRAHWRHLILAMLAGAASAGSGVGLLTVAAWLISTASTHPPVVELSLVAVAVRAFALTRATARYAERLLSHDVALRLLADLRTALYRRIVALAPEDADRLRSGDAVTTLVSDIDRVVDVIPRVLVPAGSAVIVAACALTFEFAVLPAAGLITLVCLAMSALAVPYLTAVVQRSGAQRLADARRTLAGDMTDYVEGMNELNMQNAADAFRGTLDRSMQAVARLERRQGLVTGITSAIAVAAAGASLAGVLAVAASAHASGAIGPAMVATLALCAFGAVDSMSNLASVTVAYRDAVVAADRLAQYGDDPESAVHLAAVHDLSAPAHVHMEGVGYSYGSNGGFVVHDIDLDIAPGGRVAIVGPSGAGKSTLAALLAAVRRPSTGTLTLNDVRYERLDPTEVRSKVVLVDSDSYLFRGTLRDNMRLARPDVTDAQLEAAAESVGLATWIAGLADGWDTAVTELGRNVSGGEHRRLVVARALLAEPDVLVLDEPTAHLDAVNAAGVMQTVLQMDRQTSLVVITHRLDDLDAYDEVVVMDHGSILERGTYDELQATGEWLQRMTVKHAAARKEGVA